MNNDPDLWDRVNNIALVIANETDGMSTNWVESACYPDDIKANGAEYFNLWHYVNKPINEDGIGHDNPITPNFNSLDAISAA